jgi:hypothetical protein
MKQQSAGRHVAPLGHIILIQRQPIYALPPKYYMLSGEATNTNWMDVDVCEHQSMLISIDMKGCGSK